MSTQIIERSYYPSGNLKYIKHLKKGAESVIKDGVTIWYYDMPGNPVENILPWKNDRRNGFWVGKYKDGTTKFSTYWLAGMRQGKSRGWHPNGKKEYETQWKDNERHGREIHWYPSGRIHIDRHWKNNLKNGREIHWYPSGRIHIDRHWKNNLKNGMEIHYFDNFSRSIKQKIYWKNNVAIDYPKKSKFFPIIKDCSEVENWRK
jgi:antitoxin component YwqK of YwqJK toxin-antitoxin module